MLKNHPNQIGIWSFCVKLIRIQVEEEVKAEEKEGYVFSYLNGRPDWVKNSEIIQEYWLAHIINMMQ